MNKEQIQSILILLGLLSFVESDGDLYKGTVRILEEEGVTLANDLAEVAVAVDKWAIDNNEAFCEMIVDLIKEQSEKVKCSLLSTHN